MAPAKNAENTTFSCHCMSADWLARNQTATTMKAMKPAHARQICSEIDRLIDWELWALSAENRLYRTLEKYVAV